MIKLPASVPQGSSKLDLESGNEDWIYPYPVPLKSGKERAREKAELLAQKKKPNPEAGRKEFSEVDQVPLRSSKEYFEPFESLGLEVGSLEGVVNHLFCLGLESDQAQRLPGLRPIGKNRENVKEVEDLNVSSVIRKDGNFGNETRTSDSTTPSHDYIGLNFTKSREVDKDPMVRFRRIHVTTPQPLFLTGKSDAKPSREFIFTRYHQTLNFEQVNPLIYNILDQQDNAVISREIFYRSMLFNPDQRYRVRIIGVDEYDMISLKVEDPTVKADFESLSSIIRAYYDTTLINPKRERIPVGKVRQGMIAVAAILPRTANAKFIRVRVGPLKKVKLQERTYKFFSVFDVDQGGSHSVSAENLYYIDSDFMQLPFLVNKYQLKDFDFFQGTKVITNLFQKIVNVTSEQFRAEFSKREDRENIPCVHLFLGKGQTEQDVNYLFLQAVYRCFTPTVPTEDYRETRICHFDLNSGKFWLQFPNPVLQKLLSYEGDNGSFSKLSPQSIDSICRGSLSGEVFSTFIPGQKVLGRAKVKEIFYRENKVLVEFIDFGTCAEVKPSDIFEAKMIDPVYAQLPGQALAVKFIDFNKIRKKEKFLTTPKDLPVYVRIRKQDAEDRRYVQRVVATVKSEAGRYNSISSYLNGLR